MRGDEVGGVRLINDEKEVIEVQTKSIVVATGVSALTARWS